MSLADLLCVSCKRYLFGTPRQCDCGDRLCGKCYEKLKNKSGQSKFTCLSCGEVNILENCFRDRAVEYELRNSTLKCLNPSCPWEGESRFYQEHHAGCKFGTVSCPNSTYGCAVKLTRSEVVKHLKLECQFNSVTCRYCGKHTTNEEIHIQRECDQVLEHCPNGCGERLPRREIFKHTRTVCTHQIRDCDYKDMGCQYKGTIKNLAKHAKEYTAYHTQLLKMANKEMKAKVEQQMASWTSLTEGLKDDLRAAKSEILSGMQSLETRISQAFQERVRDVQLTFQYYYQQFQADERTLGYQTLYWAREPGQYSYPHQAHFNPDQSRLVGGHPFRYSTDFSRQFPHAAVQLQDGLGEVSLLLQTLQAASYDGTFIWKISEVTRRRQEARTGKTVSLYSAPFYTSRHGYKACLSLYMNGDGAGKGTHLSFFITLMRSEYDALLPWPFRQAVTLTLVDQNKQRDIVQSFRPEPTSSSFQRPRNEMNIASGCPMFASVSVLDNSSYVKDDTMFLKCKIDTTGLANE